YENGVEKQFLNTRYAKQLTSRGFNTIMILTNNPNVEEILNLCDAFLITGGSDIEPAYYNEKNEGQSKKVYPDLDVLDKAIVEHAFKNQKPILGICRGHQAINIFLGGSLYQHIDNHEDLAKDHMVQTTKNDFLAFKEIINVNSYHHQAVKELAPGLELIASYSDGTVEAFVHKTLPIIGIQWHPEILADSEETKLIFDLFKKYIEEK
ncbi:MAG: type 1 glutamine amidotransferase, partial [Bacilli bacterium]